MLAFIDESGDHNLELLENDQYPIFVLCAALFQEDEYATFDEKLKCIKSALFKTEEFILHTTEIGRPTKSKQSGNERFMHQHFRRKFFKELNLLITESNFELVCAVIKKKLRQGSIFVYP